MDKKIRIKIMDDTIKCLKHRQYVNSYGNTCKINQSDLTFSEKQTEKYSHKEISSIFRKIKSLPDHKIDNNILIINGDTFDIAIALAKNGFNPVVLNMASFSRPGGGYLTGASAQEESLFRRSNLCDCLDPSTKKVKLYPINYDEMIYTPNSVVFKGAESSNYEPLDQYYLISVITCPAVRQKE